MIGNFPQGLSLVLYERCAISEFESSLTQEFTNTINLRTLEVETFNILKVDHHIEDYGLYTVITEQRIHKNSSYFVLIYYEYFCSPSLPQLGPLSY